MATSLNTRHVRFPVYEFLVVFLPVAIVILVGGFMFTSMNLKSRFEEIVRIDREHLILLRGFIGAEVKGSLHHLQALAEQPELTAALDTGDPRRIDALKAEFFEFARRNPQYQQVRWIDERGLERIRIDRDGKSLALIRDNDLQDKSGRYYVQQTAGLLRGEIYVSPVDLNVEHGKVEMPPRPVLRIATPLFDSARRRRGTLVLNLSLRELFEVAEKGYRQSGPNTFLLLNGRGELLNGTDPQATAHSLSFSAMHPNVWHSIESKETGDVEADEGFWTWNKVSSLGAFDFNSKPVAVEAGAVQRMGSDNFTLILVAKRPAGVLMDMRRDSRVVGSLGAILAVTVFGFALYLYLSGLVRAQKGQLAAADAMVRASRAEKEKELEQRFHALVEASSIGQLVVDESGTIVIANRAIQELLGYAPEDLIEKPIEELLAADFRERHVALRTAYLSAPEARKMGNGRVFDAMHRDGFQVQVEVGLNPYSENGQQRVLVNVVGVAPR